MMTEIKFERTKTYPLVKYVQQELASLAKTMNIVFVCQRYFLNADKPQYNKTFMILYYSEFIQLYFWEKKS